MTNLSLKEVKKMDYHHVDSWKQKWYSTNSYDFKCNTANYVPPSSVRQREDKIGLWNILNTTFVLSSHRALSSGEQGNLHPSSCSSWAAKWQMGGQSHQQRGQVCPAVHPVFPWVHCGEIPHVCCRLDPLWYTPHQPEPRNWHLHSLQSLVWR